MNDIDAATDVLKTLKELREAATKVCVLSHILESTNPDKKRILLDIRTASTRILEQLDDLEAVKPLTEAKLREEGLA